MSDLVGNTVDRFSCVTAHLRTFLYMYAISKVPDSIFDNVYFLFNESKKKQAIH